MKQAKKDSNGQNLIEAIKNIIHLPYTIKLML